MKQSPTVYDLSDRQTALMDPEIITVEYSTTEIQGDCDLCQSGDCIQEVRTLRNGNKLIIHGVDFEFCN